MGVLDYLLGGKKVHSYLNHRTLYILGLMVTACGLGWSNALMTIGQSIVFGNWIIEFDFQRKLKALANNKLIWVLASLYLLHLIGLSWTENFEYAFKDLKIKLPLLSLPILIGTSEKLKRQEWRVLLSVYLSTLFLLTMASLSKLIGIFGHEILDKRELSIYISHIRYGLNLVFALFLAFRFRSLLLPKYEWIGVLLSLWFLGCILLFSLYTALLILGIIAVIFGFYFFTLSSYPLLFRGSIVVGLFLIAGVAAYTTFQVYEDFNTTPKLSYNENQLQEVNSAGNYYYHDTSSLKKENGVFIYRYIVWQELKSVWEKKSELEYFGLDKSGQNLETTIFRYLSSRGLRKDSVGLSKLKDYEIEAIENGTANSYYLNHNKIENRIYSTFYELDNYSKTGFADGFSLVMRIEFWKTAWHIIQSKPLIGTGTGDVNDAFQEQYELDQSSLGSEYRRRTHNQFLTFWVTFGTIGLLCFLIFLVAPFSFQLPDKTTYTIFWLILVLSFLNEDTLETQAGLSLFAFFNSILLLGLNQLSTSK